ncbi:hypothetical protein [Devosia sp.]|uniref:hypothetical protein n=1 Tax=Devosia sp. TaxID=1871048 RepID=UPI00261AB821|nr:hypothetical protein [Devosia sp.]
MEVLVDGGSRQGLLVLEDGKLAAVFVLIDAAETGKPTVSGGWYLEAGFGPCGQLISAQPDVFPVEDDALRWTEQRLNRAGKH